jgi:hypothetical protein
MNKDKKWTAVGCSKHCFGGMIGMDNCNIYGRTGSELVYIPTKDRYPNTK